MLLRPGTRPAYSTQRHSMLNQDKHTLDKNARTKLRNKKSEQSMRRGSRGYNKNRKV